MTGASDPGRRWSPHAWTSTRMLTFDLLATLGEDDLAWSPGPGLGSLGRQFRHLARVEANYLDALRTGEIAFGPPPAELAFAGELAVGDLSTHLRDLDERLADEGVHADRLGNVDWFGREVPVDEHLSRLLDHEMLHQGMLAVAVLALDRPFPPSWESWGL